MFAREEPPHPSVEPPHPGAEARQCDISNISKPLSRLLQIKVEKNRRRKSPFLCTGMVLLYLSKHLHQYFIRALDELCHLLSIKLLI